MKMFKALSFDDVLMVDKFSEIASRKDVDPSVNFLGLKLTTPVISSNMDCVTGVSMARAMGSLGVGACLPRFWSIQENVESFKEVHSETIVSCGIGETELERAKCLFEAGASRILVDVAAGATSAVVEHTRKLRGIVNGNAAIIVGNFSNAAALKTFLHKLPCRIDAVKVGIGGGAACLTRVVTGCGMPTLASIIDCREVGLPIIADGGIRNSGDFAKSMAAGATTVMCGKLFVGCGESPAKAAYVKNGKVIEMTDPLYEAANWNDGIVPSLCKRYSGSASAESYEAQGKLADWRTPEGDSYWVPVCGPVAEVVQKLNAGLRSAMAYNNSLTINDFWTNAEFIQITTNGALEGTAHGKLD